VTPVARALAIRVVLAAACAAPLAGCATTRAYPVCFFRERPPEAQLEAYGEATAAAVALYVGPQGRQAFSWNKRVLIVHGPRAGQRRLAQVWPRLGCVGSYVDDTQYQGYARCQRYVQHWLAADGPNPVGELSDGGALGQLYCDGNGN
jgi:hypothetical protein